MFSLDPALRKIRHSDLYIPTDEAPDAVPHPLRVGEYMTVTERDGRPLAFLVSLCERIAA